MGLRERPIEPGTVLTRELTAVLALCPMVQHAEDPTVFTWTPHFPRSGVQNLGLLPVHPEETPPHGEQLKHLLRMSVIGVFKSPLKNSSPVFCGQENTFT